MPWGWGSGCWGKKRIVNISRMPGVVVTLGVTPLRFVQRRLQDSLSKDLAPGLVARLAGLGSGTVGERGKEQESKGGNALWEALLSAIKVS